jgi:Ran GTPase-activating protein (RanGAP) involved in mRNA processing and transport
MACLERFGATNDTILTLQPYSQGFKVLDSDLVDIATELQYNRVLTSLDLTNCTMSLEAATAIGRTLSEANKNMIAHVNFSNCGLNASTIAPLANILAHNDRIEAASYSENSLRDEGALHVAKGVELNSALRILDLSHCKIGPGGAGALGAALTKNQKLRNLSLSGNKLREAGTTAFCQALHANSSLVMLDLGGNNINREGGMAIAQLLRVNKTLESLNLGRNYLNDSIPYIANALCERGVPVRLLDVSCNRITGDVCKQMSQVLEGHQLSIACFSVEKNPISDEGLIALYHALKGTGLQFLDISECELSSHSCVVVADLMRACHSLCSLQMDGNAFGDEAGREIATALGQCRSITSINFERTHCGPATLKALAESILKQRRLRSLILAENKEAGLAGVLPVLDALANCHSLEELDLSDTGLTDSEDLLRALVSVFISNHQLLSIKVEFNTIASGLSEGIMTREYAYTLLDTAQAAEGRSASQTPTKLQLVSQTKGALTVANRSAMASNVSRGLNGSVQEKTTNSLTTASTNASSLFRPAWALTIPMPKRSDEEEFDDGDDGAKPPLVPRPDSLHHPMYPGYGKGRFSNGSIVQQLNDPVSYSTAISHGIRPRFHPTADGSTMLSAAPRRPLRQSPYSLAALEDNLAQLPVSEDQLKRKFQELDIEGNGYLAMDDFKALYKTFPTFGIRLTDKDVDKIFAQTCSWAPGKVSFDEFCILMLQVARR